MPVSLRWRSVQEAGRGCRHPAAEIRLADYGLPEIVRIYGIRHRIEQSYKRIKDALG